MADQALSLDLHGAKELADQLLNIARLNPSRIAAALYQEMQLVRNVAIARCPVAPHGGTLRASIRVEEPIIDGAQTSVSLVAGGPEMDYAVAVHEHLSDASPPSWIGKDIHWNASGTGPKFLENPIREAQAGLAERLGSRLGLGDTI